MWEEALAFMSGMAWDRIDMDTITFNTAVSVCEKGATWWKAFALFSSMARDKIDDLQKRSGTLLLSRSRGTSTLSAAQHKRSLCRGSATRSSRMQSRHRAQRRCALLSSRRIVSAGAHAHASACVRPFQRRFE